MPRLRGFELTIKRSHQTIRKNESWSIDELRSARCGVNPANSDLAGFSTSRLLDHLQSPTYIDKIYNFVFRRCTVWLAARRVQSIVVPVAVTTQTVLLHDVADIDRIQIEWQGHQDEAQRYARWCRRSRFFF